MKKQAHRITWKQLQSARVNPAPEFNIDASAEMALSKIDEYVMCSGAVSDDDKDKALICMLSAVAAMMVDQLGVGGFKYVMAATKKQVVLAAKNNPMVKP